MNDTNMAIDDKLTDNKINHILFMPVSMPHEDVSQAHFGMDAYQSYPLEWEGLTLEQKERLSIMTVCGGLTDNQALILIQ